MHRKQNIVGGKRKPSRVAGIGPLADSWFHKCATNANDARTASCWPLLNFKDPAEVQAWRKKPWQSPSGSDLTFNG